MVTQKRPVGHWFRNGRAPMSARIKIGRAVIRYSWRVRKVPHAWNPAQRSGRSIDWKKGAINPAICGCRIWINSGSARSKVLARSAENVRRCFVERVRIASRMTKNPRRIRTIRVVLEIRSVARAKGTDARRLRSCTHRVITKKNIPNSCFRYARR